MINKVKKKQLKNKVEAGDQSASGHTPNPQKISNRTTLDRAHRMGLYDDADEEHPKPVGLGREINKDEKSRHGR